MSLLSKTPRLGRMDTGLEHIVKIANYREFETDKGGYLQVQFVNKNGQLELVTYFPSMVNTLVNQLRNGLGIKSTEAVTDEYVLELAKTKEFKIKISYKATKDRSYRNVQIINPLSTTNPTEAEAEAEAKPESESESEPTESEIEEGESLPI